LDEWRLVDAELDVAEWRATPAEKAASVVANAAVCRLFGGEEGWRRWRWSAIEREVDGGVVTLEHRHGGAENGEERTMAHERTWLEASRRAHMQVKSVVPLN
jgi:hypothetical protein